MYFKNLNSVLFIATSLVVIHHLEQIKEGVGLSNHWDSPAVQLAGKLGVIVLFALSGFLITSLLIAERRAIKRINLRDFYIRRVLRIWPLYFVVVTLSIFVLPFIPFMDIPSAINPFERLGTNLLLLTFFPTCNCGRLDLSLIPRRRGALGSKNNSTYFGPYSLV